MDSKMMMQMHEKKEEQKGENPEFPITDIHIKLRDGGFDYTAFGEDKSGTIKKQSYEADTMDKVMGFLRDDLQSPHLKSMKPGGGGRFEKLSGEVEKEYEEKGKSPEEAKRIGAAVAAKAGMEKYGKERMSQMAQKGKKRPGVFK